MPRDEARLLAVSGAAMSDHVVTDLPSLLNPGDVLVFNDTKVIPAQLEGRRGNAKIGATLHKRIDLRRWQAFIRNAKRLRVGETVNFGEGVEAVAEDKFADGSFVLRFLWDEPVELLLERAGTMPLPPYIASKREIDERDADDYQTMFAEKDGAVAAPTAALHFTDRLIAQLDAAGVVRETLTLHVGAGTFQPVRVDDVNDHHMHSEYAEVSEEVVAKIAKTKANGGRVIAVGTTSVRSLESAAKATMAQGLPLAPFFEDTDIFIFPGYEFQIVDAMVTNFHLPESTLIMLLSAFAGYDNVMNAYQHAIAEKYRFFSYGDAMFVTKQDAK